MEESFAFSKFRNPYDFANPVTELVLFAGRKKEIKELNYYLNQAKNSKSPINIAFIGERASGKTSLLNITEKKAEELGLFTVRVDLDEGDIESQLNFFHKLFNALFTKACEKGFFGGLAGKSYDTYLDIVSAYIIPEDKTFCPFLFPLQFSKAMSANNYNVQVLDENLKHDFRIIYSEITKPIVILFDECDVLSNNRVILQKLRNIFMNQTGYMLVLAGTPKLFPTLDDVFSPIIRQFKKVSVERFFDESDTKDCIEKPLESIGLDAKQILDYETHKDISEIHHISTGRPYEIQLLCHVMFRRLQENKSNKMQVNYSVLKEVTEELEKSQNISNRPLLVNLNELNDLDLLALSAFCRKNGYLTFDQTWNLEVAFKGETRWTKDSFKSHFSKLIEFGFIKLQNDKIFFGGDDFDKIYIKYFSRERKLNVSIDYTEIDFYIFLKIRDIVQSLNEKIIQLDRYDSQVENPDVEKIILDFIKNETDRDEFSDVHPIFRDLYWPFITNTEHKNLLFIQINFHLPWIQMESYYYLSDSNSTSLNFESSEKYVNLKNNLKQIGGDINYEMKSLPIPPKELLIKKLSNTIDKNFRDSQVQRHISEAVDSYLKHRKTMAIYHTEIFVKYVTEIKDLNDFVLSENLNNAGYMCMSLGKYSTARQCFDKAIEMNKIIETVGNSILPLYNLAILCAFEKHWIRAKKEFEKIENILNEKNYTAIERKMACLFVITAKGKQLGHTEEFDVDILEATKKSLKTLKEIV